MYSSYLRYGFEATIVVMLQGRKLKCPEDVDYCILQDVDFFLKTLTFDQTVLWLDFLVLFMFLFMIKIVGFYFLKQKLNSNDWFKWIERFKKH